MKKTFILMAFCTLLGSRTTVAQAQDSYGFSITNVDVTSENYNQLTHVLKWTGFLTNDGTVTFDPKTKTLTLDNAHIAWPGAYFGGIKNTGCDLLTIRIKGNCTLHALTHASGYNIIEAYQTNICIEGTEQDRLNIIGPPISGTTFKSVKNYITIKNITLDMDCYHECFNYFTDGAYNIDRATVIMRQAGKSLSYTQLNISEGYGFVYPENVTWGTDENGHGCYVDGDGKVIKTPYYVELFGTWTQPAPITAVIRSLDNPVKPYNLWIGNKRANEFNCDDITGDGHFCYDPGGNTLTVSGDLSTNGKECIKHKIAGLTIHVGKDVTLAAQGDVPALSLGHNTTITGSGKLTLTSEKDAAIYVNHENTSSVLTLKDADIDASGQWGIAGPSGSRYQTKLVIANSTIVAKSKAEDGAVCDFRGGITLSGSTITVPVGGRVDGACIVDANGTAAKEVRIVPAANPADVNRDGTVDSADIVAVIKEMPDGDKKADVNGDNVIDSADIVAVIKAMK